MIRIVITALLVLSLAGVSWAEPRTSAKASGPSSNLSTKRHGWPSSFGP